MFRDASAIDSERTATAVRTAHDKYEASSDSWFDGTPDSIDRRIAVCQRLSHICKNATIRLVDRPAGRQYVALSNSLESDRISLEALRHDILTAGMYREAFPNTPEMQGILDQDRLQARPPGRGAIGDVVRAQGGPSEEERHQQARDYADRTDNGEYEVPLGAGEPEELFARSASRFIELESRSFLAENNHCDDLQELRTRAKLYAQLKTSTLSKSASHTMVTAFINRVEELGRETPKRQAHKECATIEDFPPELFYL